MSGTEGRVYGGDPGLTHIPDGERAALGRGMAREMELAIRNAAGIYPWRSEYARPLCPGCYMVALYNMAVELARVNGQSYRELGDTLAAKFRDLARTGDPTPIEHIEVRR